LPLPWSAAWALDLEEIRQSCLPALPYSCVSHPHLGGGRAATLDPVDGLREHPGLGQGWQHSQSATPNGLPLQIFFFFLKKMIKLDIIKSFGFILVMCFMLE
jgi:hypothetical protein